MSYDSEDFVSRLREALRERVAADFGEFRESLGELVDAYMADRQEDLKRLTGLLAAGALTQAEYQWLLEARRDVGEMRVLQAAGLTLAQIDRVRAALVETTLGTALEFVL